MAALIQICLREGACQPEPSPHRNFLRTKANYLTLDYDITMLSVLNMTDPPDPLVNTWASVKSTQHHPTLMKTTMLCKCLMTNSLASFSIIQYQTTG